MGYEEGGVPLLYNVTNENLNCNQQRDEKKKKNVKAIQTDNNCILNS